MSEEKARERYRIVIGVDFEQTGDDAIADALRIAREHPNDELHVVHVVALSPDTHNAAKLDAVSDQMQAAAKKLREHMHAVCDRIFPGEEWEQDAVFHVRVGDPAEAIHQVAVDVEANVVVVGTHARTGIGKLVLGSVAEKLVRIARLPVLVARERDFEGLAKSAKPDAARKGEQLHDENYHVSDRLQFGSGGRHIAGLL